MTNKWLNRLKQQAKFFFDVLTSDELKTNFLHAIPFWIAALLTGLIAVAYSWMFSFTENLLQSLLVWNKAIIFLITPFSLLMAWYAIRLAVLGRGSGIPQVMAAIEISATRRSIK